MPVGERDWKKRMAGLRDRSDGGEHLPEGRRDKPRKSDDKKLVIRTWIARKKDSSTSAHLLINAFVLVYNRWTLFYRRRGYWFWRRLKPRTRLCPRMRKLDYSMAQKSRRSSLDCFLFTSVPCFKYMYLTAGMIRACPLCLGWMFNRILPRFTQARSKLLFHFRLARKRCILLLRFGATSIFGKIGIWICISSFTRVGLLKHQACLISHWKGVYGINLAALAQKQSKSSWGQKDVLKAGWISKEIVIAT